MNYQLHAYNMTDVAGHCLAGSLDWWRPYDEYSSAVEDAVQYADRWVFESSGWHLTPEEKIIGRAKLWSGFAWVMTELNFYLKVVRRGDEFWADDDTPVCQVDPH